MHAAGRRCRAAAVFLAAALAALAGCTAKPRGPVIIGAVYNLTGSQAALDVPSAQGANVAVIETNRAGGVLGRRVELALLDGKSDRALVRAMTTSLLDRYPTLPGVIGLSDSDMVLAAAPGAGAYDRLFLTSGATSPRLPAQVPEFLFLACFGDNVQAAAAAEWAYGARSARTVSILYSTADSYTKLLQGYFRVRFEQLGGQVVSVQTYTPKQLSAATIAGLAPADIIYLAAQPEDAVRATELLRAAGVTTPILGGDAFDTSAWAKHPGIADVFFTTHAYLDADSRDPRVIAFRNAYQQTYPGTPPSAFAALGYDSARLLLAAVAAAGDENADEVREELASTEGFEGVTGTISYAPGSRIPLKSVTIVAIDHGERRFVEQVMPQQVPPP